MDSVNEFFDMKELELVAISEQFLFYIECQENQQSGVVLHTGFYLRLR